MRRFSFLLFLALLLTGSMHAAAKPRLVIIISIDQLPYDYLTRFSAHFGDRGFRLLLDDGAVFANARYAHAFNLTGPGHAVIATGCNPSRNGIVGNNWFDPVAGRIINCAEDSSVSILGAKGPGRSPIRLRAPTIADALRISSGFQSRVVSISHKDRSAIFMGGMLANAAYWFADSSFVSSTYYMKGLPPWVAEFNAGGMATSYVDSVWNRSLPEEAYAELDRDDAPYEGDPGFGRTFPHRLSDQARPRVGENYLNALWNSPFLNDLMMAFIKQAIVVDTLGKGPATDMLCIGLSANDAVGHTFGPESHEVLDMTVRTDRLLADFFAFIDQWIGLDQTLVVLSSDHGIPPIPEYVLTRTPLAHVGRIGSKTMTAACEGFLERAFGKPGKKMSWIARVVDGGIYINRKAITAKKQTLDNIVSALADSLRRSDLVSEVLTGAEAAQADPSDGIAGKLRRSYFKQRSGDLLYALPPYYLDHNGSTGTDHGQPHDYDSHVPVVIRGEGITPGLYFGSVSPADIAPTLSAILEIGFPAAREGRVLDEALEGR